MLSQRVRAICIPEMIDATALSEKHVGGAFRYVSERRVIGETARALRRPPHPVSP
jgi:hypothetical protein